VVVSAGIVKTSRQVNFREAVLASGLVRQKQLDAAAEALRADGSDPADPRLADYLAAEGMLTRYQADQLLAGKTKFQLGPYLIVDSLGQGGMGQVFQAVHTLMGRTVAVKVLPKHLMSPDAIERFKREIRAQAQVDHKNLVRALDAGHAGNVYYLVTEFVDGSDLRRVVRRLGKLPLGGASWIAAQVAWGLDHAHQRGLIHRDIKPGNVLVGSDGSAKLSDLGLVGFFADGEIDELSAGKMVGTADYISPEQVRSPERVGQPADIYSLGCTIYFMVTGQVPFPGGTTREKCHKQCQIPPLDPRRLNPHLDDAFVDLLADMMEKDET